jgi:2-oxoglutarate ferredoxin oxidoreductase subunit gamma
MIDSVAMIGTGGQGIVYAISVLTEALFNEGKYVSQLQSYGAEVRGGSVLAYVIYSDQPIENPFIDSFNYVIILHSAGLRRWYSIAKNSEKVFKDSDLVKETLDNAVSLPFAKMSANLGHPELINIIALGLITYLGIVKLDTLRNVLSRKKNKELNIKALDHGLREVSKLLSG